MKKRISTLLFIGALAITSIFSVVHSGNASSNFPARYDTAHGNPSGTTSCSLCHTSPPTLNATGTTFSNNNNDYCSIGPATGTCAAPAVGSFTATPASITSGQSSTLAWTLSGGTPTALSINNGVGSILGTTSRSVSPTTTTTYTITASNRAGSTTRSVTVTVAAPVLTTVSVTPSTATITSGATRQLTASPLDQNGAAFAGATISWSSSSSSVATVNASGLVTGVSAGAATITATATSGTTTRTATSAITVTAGTPVLTSVSVTPSTATITSGATRQLTASPLDQNSAPFAGATITWSSGNTPVATVNASGLVTGVSAGAATITATATSGATTRTATSAITVTTATTPDGAALYGTHCASCHNPLSTSSKKGRTAAQTQNAINNNTGGMGTSSLRSLTSAQVAAIATALATTAPVLTSVSVTPSTASITPGSTQQLTASALDQNGAPFAGATITWSSGNTPVATVNASTGLVTGVSAGTATITATATSGAITRTATSVITVTSVATPPDGAALYGTNCASCHNPLATSTKAGRTAAQTQNAINNNIGGMGTSSLRSLTTAQIAAIATVLSQQAPLPPLPPTWITDGPTLYGNYCSSCHGPLASSTKKGTTAAQTQAAINIDAGGMGRLSNLTYTQVQAIAVALTSDTTRPTVTAFTIPATSSSRTVTITTLTATDNVAVTGYMVTESATAPNASAIGWSGTPPASYTCTREGSITLYAWAKDAAGNVSTSMSAAVIAGGDTPTVTAFSIPATSSSRTVTITTFTATDNVAVTGYMVTESATAPNASASGWSGTPPASYTCTTGGSITLYAWAKDAAGNVSTSKSASVTITSTNPAPAVDLTIWPGQWLKVTMKYQGYLFGKSNSDVFNDNLEQDGNENVPKMATDHENITGYLKLVSWDPNQGVLQAEIHQKDSQTGQWVSDPLALHLIGGSSTDFLCWTQVNGDFTSGFVVRIQGKEKDGVLKSGTFKTLGGYYFVMNGGTASNSAGSLAGAISMNGSLVPEAKVPVPK